jgi:hypothetical protein
MNMSKITIPLETKRFLLFAASQTCHYSSYWIWEFFNFLTPIDASTPFAILSAEINSEN